MGELDEIAKRYKRPKEPNSTRLEWIEYSERLEDALEAELKDAKAENERLREEVQELHANEIGERYLKEQAYEALEEGDAIDARLRAELAEKDLMIVTLQAKRRKGE